MAFNSYLIFKTSGDPVIAGESTSLPEASVNEESMKKLGAIEITDYGFGVTMPVTTSRSDGGGATVGRANFEVFTCNKSIDTSTCALVSYCCTGKNIPKIVLHLYRQGEEGESGTAKYAMIVFQDCVITKVGITGGGDELPKEALEFNYGLAEYHYKYTDHKTGKPGPPPNAKSPPSFGWSTVQNKAKASDPVQKFGDFEPT